MKQQHFQQTESHKVPKLNEQPVRIRYMRVARDQEIREVRPNNPMKMNSLMIEQRIQVSRTGETDVSPAP